MVYLVMKFKLPFSETSPPAKWLIVFIGLVLGLSFLFAPRPKTVDWNTVEYSTTSSSLLYFKNIRSYYYNIYPNEKAPFILYRFKRRDRDTNSHKLQFTIVHNPLQNEAYLYAELPSYSKQYPSLSVKFPETKPFIWQDEQLKNDDYYQLGAQVFNHLIDGRAVYLCSANDTLAQLYASKKAKLNAETVLEDYFKLVNKQ